MGKTTNPGPQGRPAVRVGCARLPAGWARRRYFQNLAFLETSSTFLRLPRPSALQRWRQEAEPNGRFGLVAWQVITHVPGASGYAQGNESLAAEDLAGAGHLKPTATVRAAVRRCADVVRELAAETIVFRTPPSFAPSASNRETVRRFFTEIAPADFFSPALRVWEPRGLWEEHEARQIAQTVGVLLASDPLNRDLGTSHRAQQPAAIEPASYFRIGGWGYGAGGISQSDLERLARTVDRYDRCWVVFADANQVGDAVTFAARWGPRGKTTS